MSKQNAAGALLTEREGNPNNPENLLFVYIQKQMEISV